MEEETKELGKLIRTRQSVGCALQKCPEIEWLVTLPILMLG